MSTEEMKIKWEMIGFSDFIGKAGDFIITLKKFKSYPYWNIVKNGIEVDVCYFHSPTKDELSAKVQIQKCINKLINKNNG